MDDIFDEAIYMQSTYFEIGKLKGVEKGKELGYQEGFELGNIKGYEIGSEVGFYKGFYKVVTLLLHDTSNQEFLPEKAVKAITSFGVLLDDYKFENTLDDDKVHHLQQIRAKFKVIVSLLGMSGLVSFNSKATEQMKSMSF